MLDLTRPLTSALGMLLGMLAHHVGWPLVEGGSQRLADAMVTALEEQGGEVVTGHEVTDLREFDGVPAVLLDTTPRGLRGAWPATGSTRATAAGSRRYHHGPGVFKIDWILSEPVPWTNPDIRRAGTIHVAGTLEETMDGEAAPARAGSPTGPTSSRSSPPSSTPPGRPRAATSSGPTSTSRTAPTPT